jgi:hypothetical protein
MYTCIKHHIELHKVYGHGRWLRSEYKSIEVCRIKNGDIWRGFEIFKGIAEKFSGLRIDVNSFTGKYMQSFRQAS